MELGQSTVLGLANVGDDSGVDEAEFHKVMRAHALALGAAPNSRAAAV